MTVKELREWLADKPDDAEVWYQDMNYGGREQEATFGAWGITFDGRDVMIASHHFEYVD